MIVEHVMVIMKYISWPMQNAETLLFLLQSPTDVWKVSLINLAPNFAYNAYSF